MPKVYLTQAARDEQAELTANELLQATIIARMRREKLQQKHVAARIGISEPTFRRRLKNPESFTLRDLRLIAGIIGMTDAELKRLL